MQQQIVDIEQFKVKWSEFQEIFSKFCVLCDGIERDLEASKTND